MRQSQPIPNYLVSTLSYVSYHIYLHGARVHSFQLHSLQDLTSSLKGQESRLKIPDSRANSRCQARVKFASNVSSHPLRAALQEYLTQSGFPKAPMHHRVF